MFTRVAVLFSLLTVILGIWFTLPGLRISTKQAVQFSTVGEIDSSLAVYQKKTRKHSYDQSFESIKTAVPLAIQDQFSIPKNTEVQEKIITDFENQNKYVTNVNFVETETLKKEIAAKNPNISKDYFGREDKIPKIDYRSGYIKLATASNQNNQIKGLFSRAIGSMQGFSSSSIENGATGIKVDEPFTLTFDRIPDNSTIENLSFSPDAEFTKSLNKNILTITPIGMNRDTNYTFSSPIIANCVLSLPESCEQKPRSDYTLSFQTDYKQKIVYGKSEEGIDLVSNIYGNCIVKATCKKIMLTGGVHGSEWQSGDLAKLQTYIEQNPQEIINKNKIIIIVPLVNPDGKLQNKRYNANDINLNRNFPTNFINCDICGSSPLSEKESKYLVDFTLLQKPDVLISYHSQWPPDGIIFKGDDNNPKTINFAEWVSQRTGYPVGSFSDSDSVPGDQTVWAESQGISSLLVESKFTGEDDWGKNFNLYTSLLRDY
jgi:hypothetical protein